MEKNLHSTHSVRCIITRPSECGKSVVLTNLILKNITEYDKIYIYSPSLHQDLCHKINKSFSNYIPINILPNILNEEDIDVVIEEIVKNKDFEKSGTEIKTYESIQKLKYLQEYKNSRIFILDDLNEEEINNDKTQAMFKRGRHNNLSIFIISQDYYELPKKTIRANGNIYHIFKPNNFRDIPKLYQDKAFMDMTLNDLKLLTYICWNEKYQPLTIIKNKDEYTGDIDKD